MVGGMNIHSAMSTAEARREPAGADKRQAILDAALELFAERGFHGTAVPLVAEKAGVGAGTVYRYFESKEALVNALYRAWKGQLAQALLVDFPVDEPPRAQFHECWRRLCGFAMQHPKAFVFLELHHHAPYLDEQSRAADLTVLGPLYSFVAEAQTQQILKPARAELLMAIAWGSLVGVIRATETGHLPPSDLADLLDQAENCVWEAIRR